MSDIFLALTETEVRAQLLLEEGERLKEGGESLHATTPSAFIMHGLDLEDAQYAPFFYLIICCNLSHSTSQTTHSASRARC